MVRKTNSEHQTKTMRNKQNIIGVAATCAGIFITTALQADAQQDNGAFNAGVKAAQQDAQFIQGVQAGDQAAKDQQDKELLEELMGAQTGVSKIVKSPANKDVVLGVYITVHVPLATSLPPAYAKSTAMTAAGVRAKGELTKWIVSECSSGESDGEEALTQIKGSNSGQGAASTSESALQTATKRIDEAKAKGMVRAVTAKAHKIEDGIFTAVYSWSFKGQATASAIEAANNAPRSAASSRAAGDAGGSGDSKAAQGVSGVPIAPIKDVKAKSKGISDDF